MGDIESYLAEVKKQLERLGLAKDDIDNIVDSNEGMSIIRANFRSNCSPSACVDDILYDAPDHILNQLGW